MVQNYSQPQNMVAQSVVFALSGLFIGVVIDKLFAKTRAKYNTQNMKVFLVLLQVVVLALTITSIYIVSANTALHFQETIAGLGFPAMFFGVQSDLFTTVQSLV
jgi:uncharacterized protein YacL